MKYVIRELCSEAYDELLLDMVGETEAEKDEIVDFTIYRSLRRTSNSLEYFCVSRVCSEQNKMSNYFAPIFACSYMNKKIYVLIFNELKIKESSDGGWCGVFMYRPVSIIKFNKDNFKNHIMKMNMIGRTVFNRKWLFSNMRGLIKKGCDYPMEFLELTCREHQFRINLTNIANIRKEDIDKISEAWSINYFIYLRICGEGEELYLEIISTRITCEDALDIRKDWCKFAMLLRENPPKIPSDWIDYVKKQLKGGN